MKKLLILCSITILAKVAGAQTTATPAVVTVPPEGAQVRMTIAQNDEAMISDRRASTLPAGRSLIRFTELPNPDKLEVNSVQPFIGGPGAVDILEQRFQGSYMFGVTEAIVLTRYIGQTVTLLRTGEPAVKGTLLMAGEMVLLDTADGLMVNPRGTFVVPRATDNITNRSPSALTWLADVAAGGQYSVEARYITKGLNWQPLYRASFNATGDRLSLRGWLKVDNFTQVSFRAAQVSLQTGKLGDQTPLFKYPRAVELLPNGSQQLAYVAAELPVARELVFFAAESQTEFTKNYSGAPQVSLRVRNTADIGLGVPLPAGPLEVWGVSADGTPLLVAERTLPATAPDQEFRLRLGDAPKVFANREVTNSRQLNPRTMEHTVQITLSNQREEAVTVLVLEQLPTGAKITESTPAPTMREAENRAEYRVTVPADGTAVVKYVVEVKN